MTQRRSGGTSICTILILAVTRRPSSREETFYQLQQRTGVGFDKSHKSSVVALFDWSPKEEPHLGSLF
jgi:hypothetical protein